MTEKRVSVRLAAVAGRQVRAELEGVGDAGAKGFGRLSCEMDAANQRLAVFSRRAKLVVAAAAAAFAAGAVAMVRSSLQAVDAQSKLAASLGATVASIQALERAGDLAGVSMGQVEQATAQLTRRLSQAAGGTGPAAAALQRLRLSAEALQALPLDQRIAAVQERLAALVPEAERAAVASQLFGDRAALVFTRIDTARPSSPSPPLQHASGGQREAPQTRSEAAWRRGGVRRPGAVGAGGGLGPGRWGRHRSRDGVSERRSRQESRRGIQPPDGAV